MSGADVTVLNNTNFGNLSKILASEQTLWANRGFDTTNIQAVDNAAKCLPVGQQADFGGEDRFKFRKRGGRIHHAEVRLTVTAGVLAAGIAAAYVDDFSAAVNENARVEYASKTIQEYVGEAEKAYHRLTKHDISRECYNALALAGMPPGAAGGAEAQRQANVTAQFQVTIPLSWMYFTTSEDYSLTPEALSAELDFKMLYRRLEQLVYARVIATGLVPTTDIWTTRPRILTAELLTQLVVNTVPEKALHLSTFEAAQGNIYKILDMERQLGYTVPAAAGTYTFKLDNCRLDAQMTIFFMRDNLIRTNYAVDRMQSDPTSTILSGGGSVAALQPIISFRMLANGGTIVDTTTDLDNRALWRMRYMPGVQIAEAIYFVPWSWLVMDKKNVSGFQNFANLGESLLFIF